MTGIKKIKENAKKVLTKREEFGNLTKLFGERADGPRGSLKKRRKKWLTNEGRPVIIAFRRLRRVPCKLNNVKERKHQTERLPRGSCKEEA